jgi:hypothetical protein
MGSTFHHHFDSLDKDGEKCCPNFIGESMNQRSKPDSFGKRRGWRKASVGTVQVSQDFGQLSLEGSFDLVVWLGSRFLGTNNPWADFKHEKSPVKDELISRCDER